MSKLQAVNDAQSEVKNKFWNFVQEDNKPAELILYGPIASQQSWWEDRVTPQQFNNELKAIGDVDEIVVRINSGGGDVFAANAIYTRLKDHKATITIIVDGWAASAATIICMSADVLKIPRNAVFMIHDPKLGVYDYCGEEELIKMANELKVIKQSIVNGYALKTGKDVEIISDLMKEETWWTGEEAVENGFCDELMFESVVTDVQNSNKIVVNSVVHDIEKFKTVPKSVLNSISDNTPLNNTKNKGEKTMSKPINTIQELETEYPALVKNLREEATNAERERIKAINDMAIDGFEDVVNDAIYTNPIAPEKVAMNIIAKQKGSASDFLKGRDKDVQNSNMSNVANLEDPKNSDDKTIIDNAINKTFGIK